MTNIHSQRVRIVYKTILRLHRGLPDELRALGDSYAKEEFKRHKNCKPEEAAAFMTEWTNYAMTVAKQLGLKGIKNEEKLGKPLNENDLNAFKDDQVQQLYELKQATKVDTPQKS